MANVPRVEVGSFPVGVELAVLSRPGGRERNEDSCGHVFREGIGCFVLADGAGGHQAGDVASRTAVDAVLAAFTPAPLCTPGEIRRLLETANESVLQAQEKSGLDMHSTVVALLCDTDRGEAVWGHAGDSRLYVFRDGSLLGRTRDHSLLQSMIDAGYVTDKDTGRANQRNVLTCSLGQPDAFEYEVLKAPFGLLGGEVFLLCSDGFWEYLSDAHLEQMLARAPDIGAWLSEMESLVVQSARPGHDNYTAMAVRYLPSELPTRIVTGD